MESLGWGNPTTTFRKVHQSACSDDYSYITEKLELEEFNLLSSSIIQPQGIRESSDSSNVNEIVEMLTPTDSMNGTTLLHHQDVRRLMDSHNSDIMESGTVWSDALLSQSCTVAFQPIIGHKIIENFGSSDGAVPVISNITNDEDDISAMFSGSENFCNLSCSGNISSGESEHYGSFDQHKWSSDEVASQISPNNPVSSLVESLRVNLNTKRKFEECTRVGESSTKSLIQPNSLFEEEDMQISSQKHEPKLKKPRSEKHLVEFSTTSFGRKSIYEPDTEAIAQVREMIYRAAALRPVTLGVEEAVEKPKRKNVKISSDPQTAAARQRRERISERLRLLQKLVPGGSKMDTATMLDEAANYLKFLKSQVRALETLGSNSRHNPFPANNNTMHPFPLTLSQVFPVQTLYSTQKPEL